MKTDTFAVSGMSCGHCSARVEEAIKALDGISSARVDLDGGKATVDYDENKVSLETIRKAVDEAGYPTSEEKPKKKGFFRRG